MPLLQLAQTKQPLHTIVLDYPNRVMYDAFQSVNDMRLWQDLIIRFKLDLIIELGTAGGGMTKWLDQFVKVISFDINPCPHFTNIVGNIFTNPQHVLDQLDQPGPYLLFCDNGDKPREFAMFAKHVRPGNYIAVHDWGTEFKNEDVDYSLVDVVVMTDHTVWFRRK